MEKEVSFEHYVVTRFNLPIFQAKIGKNLLKSCDKEYLKYRFDLFEKFCFPSFVNQSCQDFKWLVLFDSNTPIEFKERAETLHNRYKNFVPCYLNINDYSEIPEQYERLAENYDNVVCKYYPDRSFDLDVERERQLRLIIPLFILDSIKKCSSTKPEYYITTRIDNDDAFHKDMIKTIQERFIQNPKHKIIDFVYSYKFILEQRIVYRHTLQNGHFISLIEPTTQPFQSVLYWNHLYVDKFLSVEHIYGTPLQIELIHGNNVINYFSEPTFKGFLYAFIHFRRKDFGYRGVRVSYLRQLYVLGFYVKEKLKKAVTFRRDYVEETV